MTLLMAHQPGVVFPCYELLDQWLFPKPVTSVLSPSSPLTDEAKQEPSGRARSNTNGIVFEGQMTVRRGFRKERQGLSLTATTNITGADPSSLLKTKPQVEVADDGSGFDVALDDDQPPNGRAEKVVKSVTGRISQWLPFGRDKESEASENLFVQQKGQVLYLFSIADKTECLAAIALDNYRVNMEDRNGVYQGKDAAMFAKRHACVLRKVNKDEKGLPLLHKDMQAQTSGDANEARDIEIAPWYFFSKNNSK